ncbi:CCA tRNA nucleotidyltransferase [uncultured Methylobacterium sp.]|uniref:CCA tRNA nucleotidyltransferase n=1 Tax=uncultured Methylobacterium sp. TaxID=157278 RepID=UPI0035CB1554
MTGWALDRDGPSRLLRRSDVRQILDALTVPGEATRLVGGCVRDALLGSASTDIDLATTLEPDATLSLAAKAGLRAIPTGFDHGTVTILAKGTAFEVTTLREDIETDGRHAIVRFGRDFARDAERRDFTINALSLDPEGRLHDTTGGVTDLEGGRVRFIGDAASRIREDALRVLRFFRFHARYGCAAPDEAGLAACAAAREAVDGLSRERVRAELLKLLVAPGALAALRAMDEAQILERLIGGPAYLWRLARTIEVCPDSDVVTRLASLAVRTKRDAVRLQEALRLSKAEGGALTAYADASAALAQRRAIDAGAMRALVAVHDASPLAEALAAMDAQEQPPITSDGLAILQAVRGGALPRPVFPLTGADFVARGVAPGPAVGHGLNAARTLWLELGCPDDRQELDALLGHGLNVAKDRS